jgi:excisionase family DNA binding protein
LTLGIGSSIIFNIGPARIDLDGLALQEVVGMENRYLSVDEIAEYLGIKKDTVYKWVAAKRIPAHRVGRLLKFKKDEVDEWVQLGKTIIF